MSKRREKKQVDPQLPADVKAVATRLRDTEPHSPAMGFALAQWSAFALVCLLIAVLHVVIWNRSGAFWRDECASILLSRAPSWRDLFSELRTDSFPALFVVMLRIWTLCGPGMSETGLHVFGMLISLGTLVSIVLSCRAFGVKIPLLAVALVCLNSTVLYYGSAIRAYGLAALLIVACFAMFWRFARYPTPRSGAYAFLLALLSIHCNYQNCYLLFGIGTAAAATCLLRGAWKRCLLILSICFVAAVTMLVYLPVIIRYREDTSISHFVLDMHIIGVRFLEALADRNLALLVTWVALGIGALAFVIMEIRRARGSPSQSPPLSPGLYCALTVILAAVTGSVFFQTNGMFPFAWHYIPFIALAGVAIDCSLQTTRSWRWLSPAKCLIACFVAAISFLPAWKEAHLRRTNVDFIAATVESRAAPQDLILVNPFWLRPSFKQYYHGATTWRVVPIDPDDPGQYWHGSGVSIKNMMTRPDSIGPTLQMVQDTLRRGGRLWIVGGIEFLPPNVSPPDLIPAPHPQYGWDNNAYSEIWSAHLGSFLRKHARKATVIIAPHESVNPLESMCLILVEGWGSP